VSKHYGKENLRVGLIGTGNWARSAHLPAFAAQPNVKVVGITDINPEHITSLSEQFGIPGYADLERMLAEADLDVLNVVTSRGMHYEPVMAGMARGLDILCEKPLGHNINETRQLYHEARQRKLVTHMGFTFRYSPAVQNLRDLVLDGFEGEVYHLQGFEENAQLVDPNTPLPRIGFSHKTGSGALHVYGSHLLDLVRWTLGEFEQVIGDMATFIWAGWKAAPRR
jgi:predicted dehydrogenase